MWVKFIYHSISCQRCHPRSSIRSSSVSIYYPIVRLGALARPRPRR
ncbi:unnamed protein product [Amoebophrya sp. A120]|nr:unnamed protein product [Amoebophrya sp. A120]|eukprot:GSA120T00008847001.1